MVNVCDFMKIFPKFSFSLGIKKIDMKIGMEIVTKIDMKIDKYEF